MSRQSLGRALGLAFLALAAAETRRIPLPTALDFAEVARAQTIAKERSALYQGTFNPVHSRSLAIAAASLNDLAGTVPAGRQTPPLRIPRNGNAVNVMEAVGLGGALDRHRFEPDDAAVAKDAGIAQWLHPLSPEARSSGDDAELAAVGVWCQPGEGCRPTVTRLERMVGLDPAHEPPVPHVDLQAILANMTNIVEAGQQRGPPPMDMYASRTRGAHCPAAPSWVPRSAPRARFGREWRQLPDPAQHGLAVVPGWRPSPHGVRGVLPEWLVGFAEAAEADRRSRGKASAVPDAFDTSRAAAPTCAVVGSGFNLKDRRLGAHIDAHDIVIRFNDAPVAGYELDVGTKTTVRLVHMKRAARILDLERARDWEWELADTGSENATRWGAGSAGHGAPAGSRADFERRLRLVRTNSEGLWMVYGFPDASINLVAGSWLASQQSRRQIGGDLQVADFADCNITYKLQAATPSPEQGLALIAPQFAAMVRDDWVQGGTAPSTGMLGVVMGLHLCEHGVVDLYGFNFGASAIRWRYFERKEQRLLHAPHETVREHSTWRHRFVHDTVRETEVLKQLAEDGVVRMVTPVV